MLLPPSWNIRPIEKADNKELAIVLREVLLEMGVPKKGTAYADPELDTMFEAYDFEKACYWVVEKGGVLYGGAGIAKLNNGPLGVCELQKMYFLLQARGQGLGSAMMKICLDTAISFGFNKCYLETMPNMSDAQKCYQKFGFLYLDSPMGNTGHFSCPVWMLKDL